MRPGQPARLLNRRSQRTLHCSGRIHQRDARAAHAVADLRVGVIRRAIHGEVLAVPAAQLRPPRAKVQKVDTVFVQTWVRRPLLELSGSLRFAVHFFEDLAKEASAAFTLQTSKGPFRFCIPS